MRHSIAIAIAEDDLHIAPSHIEIELPVHQRSVVSVVAACTSEIRIASPRAGLRYPQKLWTFSEVRAYEKVKEYSERRTPFVPGHRLQFPQRNKRLSVKQPILDERALVVGIAGCDFIGALAVEDDRGAMFG